MAHYSYASPDRTVGFGRGDERTGEMDAVQAHITERRTLRPDRRAGGCAAPPPGGLPMARGCISSLTVEGQSHLWRQRFPNGRPEQITFGPTEEEGLAVEPDGRSVITSIGSRAKRHLDS